MSLGDFNRRSNIFGQLTSSGGTSDIPYSSNEATAAGKLIDKLKNIADNQIVKVASAVDWLGMAANSGQNASGMKSLVQYNNVKPDDITTANIFKNWTAPSMPSLPSFPALPANLEINMNTFKADIDALVSKLQNMWISRYLPTTTAIDAYNKYYDYILNGSATTLVKGKTDSIYSELIGGLNDLRTAVMADVSGQITAAQTAVSGVLTGLQPRIDAALAKAQDTSDIIFARGRDQVAREAARLDAEAQAEWAARGFSLPGGVLLAQQAMSRQATLDAVGKLAADEAARVNAMNMEVAKTAVDAWLRYTDLQARTYLEAMTGYIDARMKASGFLLDAYRSQAETAIRHLGLEIDMSKGAGELAVRYRLGVQEGMNGLVQAYAALNRGEMEYYAAIAAAQRANLQALIEYYRLSLAQSEMGMKVSLSNRDADIKWAEVAGQFIGNAVAHHVQAASATGNLYAQIAGMALSGLNGVASQSVSG